MVSFGNVALRIAARARGGFRELARSCMFLGLTMSGFACSKGSGTGMDAGVSMTPSGGTAGSAQGSGGTVAGSGGASGSVGTLDPFVPLNENCGAVAAMGDAGLIDDLEDQDSLLLESEGRDGEWYSSGDDSAGSEMTFGPEAIPDGRGTSAFAWHTTGTGMVTWGAVTGFGLRSWTNDDAGVSTSCAYDASVYDRIEFWARGSGERLRVKATLMESIPVSGGGICAAENPDDCWNDHGVYITLEEEWQKYVVPFSELTQDPSWGILVDFNPAHIQAIRFQTDVDVDFDYWIDDVAFARGDAAPADGG